MRTLALLLIAPVLLLAAACGSDDAEPQEAVTPDVAAATAAPTPPSGDVPTPLATEYAESPTTAPAETPAASPSVPGENPTTVPPADTPTSAPPPPTATATAEPEVMEPQAQVYFVHAEWWPNCRPLRPVWADLQSQYGDRLTMAMIDFDTNEGKDFARAYRVNYHPGFIAIDSEGDVVYAGLEIRSEEALRSLVESLFE